MICKKVNKYLTNQGYFIFSVEHPIFTACSIQDWYYDSKGNRLHWAVDNYFYEGLRKTIFLDEEVTKYHKTLTTYVSGLLKANFEIISLVEPMPEQTLLETVEGMKDELRRPMMLLISAKKRASCY